MQPIKKKARFCPSPPAKDAYERLCWQKGLTLIGIDEVGRGCLAGPVVAAALILMEGKKSKLLMDSKLLSAPEREKAFLWIKKNGLYSIGIVDHHRIDEHNIYKATLIAMKRAVIQLLSMLQKRPGRILVDAMPLSLQGTAYESLPIDYFPFGESLSSSIAAASIVAKITRDRLMKKMGDLFPLHNFAKHKGYGTCDHKQSLCLGTTFIHRHTFLKNQKTSVLKDIHEQQSIW